MKNISKKALIFSIFLTFAILLSACQLRAATTEATSTVPVIATVTPAPTIVPATTSLPFVPSPEIFSAEATASFYETVLSIPAGKTGLPYRGVDIPGMEITGPNAFAILSDGRYVIADLIDNRLWIFSPAGEQLKIIDLYTVGIMNVSDMQVYNDELYVLEIYLNPPLHYRINRLSLEGELKAYYDIPEGYHLENGLTAFMIDCNGKIFLDLEGRLHPLPIGNVTLTSSASEENYECNGKTYYVHETKLGEKPKLTAGSFTLETSLTFGYGGLSLLKVLPDGSFFVVRSDVVNDPVIQVDDTVHYFSAGGVQLGIARVPVDERYYYVMRNLTVGPDGNVYCLLPKPDSLKILRLKFYTALEPLLPGAEFPTITTDAPLKNSGN